MSGKFDYNNNPTWRIFRIMAEFVDGFNFLSEFDKTVTFFGSARLGEDNPYCRKARELAQRLGEGGFTVITGGGPGIMEAANRGANTSGAESVGLNIELAKEQRANEYLTKWMGFDHFFTRKVMLSFSAEAYVFFPGGFGTLDEFFELINLIQTKKIEEHIPIVLFGSDFWQPLLTWIKDSLHKEYKLIDARDYEIWTLTDSIDEAFSLIKRCQPRKKFGK